MRPRFRAEPGARLDGAPIIPHSGVLVAYTLVFLAIVCALSGVRHIQVEGGWSAGATATIVAAVVAALATAVLLGARRARTTRATLVGLVICDLVPLVNEFGSLDVPFARVRVVLLVIPTIIAASGLPDRAHRAHLAAVAAIAAVMVAVPDASRSPVARLLETTVAVAVLVAAGLLVRRLSRATTDRIVELHTLSMTDGLTGVLNRRGLVSGFDSMARGARRDAGLGLLIVDIDHFKWFNDEYGHAAGDEILRRVCDALTVAAGPGNIVARIGGEELAALVAGPAEPVAQEFRRSLACLQPHLTASIGIVDATRPESLAPGALHRMLEGADHALYEAKNTGRDRICRGRLGGPSPETTTRTRTGHAAFVPSPMVDARDPEGESRRTWWAPGALAADMAIVATVLGVPGSADKLLALLPMLLAGILLAQKATRPAVLMHHALVVSGSLFTLGTGVTVLSAVAAVLYIAVLVGSVELVHHLRRWHDEAATELHRWTVTDPLTGLANRRGLELAFGRMPPGHSLTVLALDVDDFKSVNDRHGHGVGDDTLVRLAATLRSVTDPGTVIARTGGDEFVVLAPAAHAATLAARICHVAALLPVPLSMSIGSTVAVPYQRSALWPLVAAADAELTRAKRARRVARSASAADPGGIHHGHPTDGDRGAARDVGDHDGGATEPSADDADPRSQAQG